MVYTTKVLVDKFPQTIGDCPFSIPDDTGILHYCRCGAYGKSECVLWYKNNPTKCDWLKPIYEEDEQD